MNLSQINKKYPSHKSCIEYIEEVRWQGTPICPYCGAKNATPVIKELRYHCNNCHTSFSVTVDTPFHRTRIELQKWFVAVYQVVMGEVKSGRQLSKDIGVTKDTGMLMLKRLNKAIIEQPDFLNELATFKRKK
jgi:transposase-like protein